MSLTRLLQSVLSLTVLTGTWKRIVEEWPLLTPAKRWIAIAIGGMVTGSVGALVWKMLQ